MNLLYKALIFIEEILFPPCCLLCGKMDFKIWCNCCKKKLYEQAVFKIEKKKKSYFENHIYIFKYEGEIRNLILNYKFKNKPYLYKIFSEIIIKNKKICGILKKYDIIISVPLYIKRKKERGFNQSELIAREIAKRINSLSLEKQVLEKYKNTLPQNSLNKKQRKYNVKNVYRIKNKDKIKNKKIILIDDIYTTGNTTKECSRILKENGAKKILVLTIAKD